MNETETLTEYLVTYTACGGRNGGRVRIQVADRADAPAEALRKLMRGAKEYNAKYSAQGLPEWALREDQAGDYVIAGVRKAPKRKG